MAISHEFYITFLVSSALLADCLVAKCICILDRDCDFKLYRGLKMLKRKSGCKL